MQPNRRDMLKLALLPMTTAAMAAVDDLELEVDDDLDDDDDKEPETPPEVIAELRRLREVIYNFLEDSPLFSSHDVQPLGNGESQFDVTTIDHFDFVLRLTES